MDFDKVSQQRVDFTEHPDGSVTAVATVTLPDGSAHRFEARVDVDEVNELASVLGSDDVAGFLGKLWKGVKGAAKGVVHVVKAVAASKVVGVAAKGLAMIAPSLGPAAPAALATAGAMGIAHKLATADLAHKAGAPKAAAALTRSAVSDAHRLTKGNPTHAKQLLAIANVKRKNLAALAGLPNLQLKPAISPAMTRSSASTPMQAARMGKLRSNRPGPTSARELASAAATGRVFWLS